MNVAKYFSFATIVAALLLPVLGSAQDLEIFNGSFEQLDAKTGLPLGWTPWNPQRNLTAFTLGAASSGVASALVTDDNATDSQGLRSRPVKIEGGKTYEASVRTKVENLQAGGFACYLEYWNGTERLLNSAASTSQVGDWTDLKVSAQAPAEATTATILIYGSSASIGVAYFDDATLRLLP
ncbi:MAG: carbohydrate binding domain-containing protein [Armatimonadia bacterium]